MQVKSQAIVLSSLKYGESDLIVKCFTLERGTTSYLLRGILKSSKSKLKAAYFQPLSQLTIDEFYKTTSTLHSIRDVKIDYHYQSLYTNVMKSSIALFLSETLSIILREEEPQEELFHFLTTSFQTLDQEEKATNFHLLFLIRITKYLGIYPQTQHSDFPCFNLKEAKFESSPSDSYTITGRNVEILKTLLGTDFDGLNQLKLTSKERQSFLNSLLVYFELHLGGFKKPKSLDVLNTIYNN